MKSGTTVGAALATLGIAVLVLMLPSGAFAADASTSVVGGSDTTAAEYPWQVAITANGFEFCGGTLIHPMIILTAAHCLVDEDGNYFEDLPGVEFRAYTGQTRLGTGGEELDWRVSRIDPEYNADTETHDWGFISLNNPAGAPTLKLAGPNESSLWKAGRKASVSGFGDLSDGGESASTLQHAAVPILADSGCANYGSFFSSATMLCAGYAEGGRDACQGDSGGPLSVTADHGVRRLVGVVSTGKGCALSGFPGIYSRVASAVNSDRIQLEVATIEADDGFPSAYTGIDVVGSGARPLGCSAAADSRRLAEQRVKSKRRALKAARRSGNDQRIRSAERRLESAKYRLGLSRTKSRKVCS